MIEDLKAIERSASVLALRETTMAAFSAQGFPSAYFIAPVSSDRSVGRVLTNVGFPEEWEKAYRAGEYKADPLTDYALAHRGPFWLKEGLGTHSLNAREKTYLQRLADFGMDDGVGMMTYGPGTRSGFVYTGRTPGQEAGKRPDLTALRTIGQMSYLRYCEMIDAEIESEPSLSLRELQVLYWIAQGKSNSVTADILGISPATVDTHTRRIFAKLGSHDRTSAALAGVTRGLISLPPSVPESVRRRQPN